MRMGNYGGCKSWLSILLALLLSACTMQQYQPLPLDTGDVFTAYTSRELNTPELRDFLLEHGYTPDGWPMEAWDIEALTLAALYFNPDLRVAVARWRQRQAGEITASQRPNPLLNVPAGWYIDAEEEDRSPLLLGLVLDLIWERPGKRQAKIDQAALRTAAARLEIEQTAWEVRNGVHFAVAELMAAWSTLASLQQRRDIVMDILDLLQRRQELGQVGAFELSTSRLELQRLRLELSTQETRIATARGRLAAAIGVPPTSLNSIQVILPDVNALPEENRIPVGDIQGMALQHRHDIRQALVEYAAQEAALKLEMEKQYPDINLSPGFVFDQGDSIWELGTAWILPLFHNHEGEIAEAVAQRAVLQERFLQLQADVIAQVHQARTEFLGKLNTYNQAVALAEDAAEYSDRIEQQLRAGYTDRLQFLRTRQAVGEAEQAVSESRAELLQSYATLEAALQYPITGRDWTDTVTASLVRSERAPEGDKEQ